LNETFKIVYFSNISAAQFLSVFFARSIVRSSDSLKFAGPSNPACPALDWFNFGLQHALETDSTCILEKSIDFQGDVHIPVLVFVQDG
jgi:hypothetical protein